MRASFKLFDRFGIRIWFYSITYQLAIAVALFFPWIAFLYYVKPDLFIQLRQALTTLSSAPSADSLSNFQSTLGEIGLVSGIPGILLLVLCWLFFSLSSASFFGTVGAAASEKTASIGHYFASGIRYLFRFSGLLIIQVSLLIIVGGIFFYLLERVVTHSYLWITLLVLAVVTTFLLLLANSYMLAVMFIEKVGVLRAIQGGFRTGLSFGQALLSWLLAFMMGLLGLIGTLVLVLFPLLSLRFFATDSTLALIAGGALGILLLLLFYQFPLILFTGTLFSRYIHLVRDRCFSKPSSQPTSAA